MKPPPASDRLRELADRLVQGVPRTTADRLVERAMARARRVPVTHRLVAVGAGVLTFFITLAGVAYLADDALPGQPLYVVDRGVERIIAVPAADRGEERLLEALALLDAGRTREAAELVDQAVRDLAVGLPSGNDTEQPAGAPDTAPPSSTTPPGDQAPSQETPSGSTEPVSTEPADPTQTLRLAAENLLATVRRAKEAPAPELADDIIAAQEAAGVLLAAEDPGLSTTTTVPGSSTTVPGSSTTSTTVPGSSTTSTAPGSSTTSTTVPGSTTTTVPGSSTTTTVNDGSDGGPILLPPHP